MRIKWKIGPGATFLCYYANNLLTEVCPNVCIEPPLQALTGELRSHDTSNSENGARLDVSAQVIATISHFFDVRVFHPNAPSYRKIHAVTISISPS